MAKTFGTGTDPKGLVNRGVEGSGAAQIFRPSQAVQDFVTGQRQQALQKQRQKQAEAKAKAERNKSLDKAFDDALKIDLKGWTEPDNQMILGEYKNILTEAAKLKAQGLNPSDDLDFSTKVAQLKLNVSALQDQKKLWELANAKAYTMAQNKQLDEEAFNNYATNITAWQQLPFAERNANIELLEPPKVQVPIDWNKGFQSLINDTKLDLTQIEADDVTITNENVPKERIEANWKNYTATNPYKEQVKVYMSEFGLSEEEASNEAKRNYVASLPTKYKKAFDEDYGGIKVNYGGNAISSDGVTAFYNPNAYNTAKDRSNIDYEAIRAFEQKPDPAEGSLGNRIVSAEGAIMFKPSKGRQEIGYRETALENGRLMLFRPNAIYKTDTGYVAFGRKRVEETTKDGRKIVSEMPTYIKIGNNNRIEIENTWLGGEDIDAAFENFKSQRKSTPQSTTVKPKAEANTPKAPNYKGVPKGGF